MLKGLFNSTIQSDEKEKVLWITAMFGISECTASNGEVIKFKKRHNITYRSVWATAEVSNALKKSQL